MFFLQLRMSLLLAALFGLVYAIIVTIGTAMGVGGFNTYLVIAGVMMLVQYLIGPKIVEWSMHVRYVSRGEAPDLYRMVEEMARRAQIPMPRICIAQIGIPNAFAFGRSQRDGRVCVTRGLLDLLNQEELRAVLGHELAHIKNRDVLTITLLSVIPMIMYHIAWHFMFYGRRDSRDNAGAAIGLVAFLFYFVSNLLVLYASRIREYFADRGSVEMGNRPSALASALYKLVYGSARADKEALRETEGLKAFFMNDPSQARKEIQELRQLDLDRSGTIDSVELAAFQNRRVRLTVADHLLEVLSTHPNMLKRIKELAAQG